jgi:hypothetical protein
MAIVRISCRLACPMLRRNVEHAAFPQTSEVSYDETHDRYCSVGIG